MTGSSDPAGAQPARMSVARASARDPNTPGLQRSPSQIVKDDLAPPEPLRKRVGSFVEHPRVEICIVGLVGIYTLVIFAQILVADPAFTREYNVDASVMEILTAMDFVILSLFVLEVTLKVYAFGKAYFENALYIFDAIIVWGSFCMSCVEYQLTDDSLERFSRVKGVLRLLRIIIMFRKVSASTSVVRSIVTSEHGLSITSPSERVLTLLTDLKESREITRQLRKDVMRAIRIIASNQLYEPVIGGDDAEGGGGGVSDAASAWINNASTQKAATKGPDAEKDEDKRMSGAARMSVVRIDSKTAAAEGSNHDSPRADGSGLGAQLIPGSAIAIKDEAMHMLQASVDNYDFDIFAFDELCQGNALYTVAIFGVTEFGLDHECGLRLKEFGDFLLEVQGSYVIPLNEIGLPDKSKPQPESVLENPYHSSRHAADVTQTMLWMINGAGLSEATDLKATEFFGLVLAAAIHDFRHPGHNNVFCTKTRAPIAVRYNDASVLEMHHIACAYELIHSNPKYNFFKACGTDSTYTSVREIVISTVCATDMSHHFSELGHFKSRIQAGDFLQAGEGGEIKKEDKLLMMNVVLHACDISNPAKSLPLYMSWTGRVLQEFFTQGDREKENKLPVSMFMDRETTNIAKCQLGFIDVLVYPLFDAIRQVLPEIEVCTTNLESNKAFWVPRVEEMDQERINGTQRLPPVGEWNMDVEEQPAK